MAAGDLHARCVELLAAASAAVATTPGGPITRAFVSLGPPAFDCAPQLTVHCAGFEHATLGPAAPNNAQPAAPRVTQALLVTTVTRCVPVAAAATPTVLPASQLAASAAEIHADAWTIWNWYVTRRADGTLLGGKCRPGLLQASTVSAPGGGVAGWQIPLSITIDGYTP